MVYSPYAQLERMDAETTIGVISGALESISPVLDVTEFPEYQFANGSSLIPSGGTPGGGVMPGVDTITYYRMTHIGVWEAISAYQTAIAKSDIRMEIPVTYGTEYYGTHIEYSSQELDRISAANELNRMPFSISLVKEKMAAVNEGYLQLQNRINSFGNTKKNIFGLLNHPDIPRMVAPRTISWANTPQENIQVLDMGVNQILKMTKKVEKPDTLLMDQDSLRILMMQTMNNNTTTAVLTHWLNTNGHVKDIETTPQNETAGSLGQPAWLYYTRSPRKIIPVMPKPMTQIGPPQPEKFAWKVYFDAQVGGVHYRRPFSALLLEFPVA